MNLKDFVLKTPDVCLELVSDLFMLLHKVPLQGQEAIDLAILADDGSTKRFNFLHQ